MSFEFDGSIAVVTGASSGLGRRLALDLAARGATVVGIARRKDLLDSVTVALRTQSPASHHVVCDISEPARFEKVLAELADRHGRIDVLVNAAGLERRLGADVVTMADVDETFDLNFRAAAAGTLAVLRGMLERGRGAVLNVSSDHGRAPGPGTPAYCASKAALSAFTESIAHEVSGRGVHVHVLYPGWVPTPLGQGAVDSGMPMPPRFVRRTEDAVSKLALDRIGRPNFEINAARVATLAPAVRALMPPIYRRSMRAQAGVQR